MGSKSPMYRVTRPITYWIPNQITKDDVNQARYKMWLEMKDKKRRRINGNK
jgi:hypothetical protein